MHHRRAGKLGGLHFPDTRTDSAQRQLLPTVVKSQGHDRTVMPDLADLFARRESKQFRTQIAVEADRENFSIGTPRGAGCSSHVSGPWQLPFLLQVPEINPCPGL